MEELTFEEQLKLGNSKEHLKVVLGNLRTANDTLTNVLEQTKTASEELARLTTLKEQTLKEVGEATKKLNEEKLVHDNREISILERENKLDSRESEVNEKVCVLKEELEKLETKYRMDNIMYNINLNSVKAKIFDAQEELKSLEKTIKENEKETKEQLRLKTSIENEVARLNSEKQDAEKELERFKVKSLKEMAEINEAIDQNKQKINRPLELIERETEKLNKLKINLDVLDRRLKLEFTKRRPGVPLPIDLQEKK